MELRLNKYILWHLFAGTKGGIMRMNIIKEIQKKPMNANQITKLMKIDYKTARHHLKVLEKNRMIQNTSSEKKYGAVYHVSGILISNMDTLDEIWEKVNKRSKGGKK